MIALLLAGVASSAATTPASSQNSSESASITWSLNDTFSNETSLLPQALPQIGAAPQPRNYVAYIPVPISDDEDDEYEDDEEYYEDDEEYYEDDEEYYYEDEEEEEARPPKRRRPPKNRNKSKRQPAGNNRRVQNSRLDDNGQEKVPFLVPLMMVPESEIGIDKKFSFAGQQQPSLPNNLRNREPILDRIPQRPLRNRRKQFSGCYFLH